MPTNYKPLIQSGFGVGISGQHVYVESGLPVVVSSGLHVQMSGQHVFVESGVHVVADIAESGLHVQISGQHVFVESGVHVVADIAESGIGVQVQSGLNVIVESGVHIEEVAVLHSGAVTVDSGLPVVVESGLGVSISGQHVFVESGAHVVISGQPVYISGQPIALFGCDYIQSGPVYCSGQPYIPTVMKDMMPALDISGWEGYAHQARLFTGADAKHIRFHDIFDARTLDTIKWEVSSGTTTVVASGYVEVENADNIAELTSVKRFLYGVLNITMKADVWAAAECGFTQIYSQGGVMEMLFNSGIFYTTNVGTGVTDSTTITPALTNDTWYNFSFVWTPEYCQLWIDGVLKATHTGDSIPHSPSHVYIAAGGMGVFSVDVANVTLKPYGDIPLTVKGAVPIAGMDSSGQYVPIRVCESGELVICSGAHVVADIAESGIGVQIQSGAHVQISGQHVFVESGVHVVTQPEIAVQSGLGVLISGQHVFVESGAYVTIESGIGVTATVSVDSGLGVLISGQHVFVESGVHVVIESGIGVTATVSVDSGLGVLISGQHVFVESGVHVVTQPEIAVQSGLGVLISGQHVFVESGVHIIIESGIGVTTDPATAGSGQVIHVGCADIIRTGKLVQVVGGTSGSVVGSGGMSLCVSGYWCSGPIHTIIIKNLANNDPVFLGEVNCKPYSGYGFQLDASEAVNLDYCDVCDVYVFAQTSGQFITWIGTDY